MFNKIITLIIKELQSIWSDKKSRGILIIMPLVQLFVFSLAATLEVKNVNIAVINNDRGSISQDLIEKFRGSNTFQKIYYLKNYNEAADYINTQKVIAVMSFQQDFSRKVLKGEPVEVQVILDGRKSNSAQIVYGYINRILDGFNSETADKLNMPKAENSVITRTWFNRNNEYIWFTVPGLLGILILTLGLVITGLSIARERELGTFDQLLVSPIQPFEILIGKTVPGLIAGMAEAVIMIPLAILIFKIPFTGSFWLLILSVFVFLLSVIGIGLFISSVAKTQQQAILGSFMFTSPSIVLSGFATPIENMPVWLQHLTLLNPLRYFITISKGIFLKDLPFDVVMANLIPMFIISMVTLTGAAAFFRRRLD